MYTKTGRPALFFFGAGGAGGPFGGLGRFDMNPSSRPGGPRGGGGQSGSLGFAPGVARRDLAPVLGTQMLRFKQSSPCCEYVVPEIACGQVGPYFVASRTSPFLSFLASLGAFHLIMSLAEEFACDNCFTHTGFVLPSSPRKECPKRQSCRASRRNP
jgi:hypothetical protein